MEVKKFPWVTVRDMVTVFIVTEALIRLPAWGGKLPSHSRCEACGPVKACGKNGVGDDVERPYPHGIGAQ